MMMKNLATCGIIALSLIAFSLPGLSQDAAANKGSNIKLVRAVSVPPGMLSGQILRNGTRQPVTGQIVTVSTAEAGVVAKTHTSSNGHYTLPKLGVGSYVMTIGRVTALPIRVTKDAVLPKLNILVSDTVRNGKGADKDEGDKTDKEIETAKTKGDTDTTESRGALVPQHEGIPTWILVTGGALAATAIVIAVVEITDDDDDPVSPSSSRIVR